MSEYVVELSHPHMDEDGDVECVYEQRERVIRCRDCRFSTFEAHLVQFSGFCSQAEPKEES